MVGLRRCARGKCIQRGAIALSCLRRGARGKCTHRVANGIGKLPKIEISVGKCLKRNRKLRFQ